MGERTTVCLIAHVPVGTEQDFLQYVRDYDTANKDCHFEIIINKPHSTFVEMVEMLRVSPELPLVEIFKRKQG